jgi:hypothetical protein
VFLAVLSTKFTLKPRSRSVILATLVRSLSALSISTLTTCDTASCIDDFDDFLDRVESKEAVLFGHLVQMMLTDADQPSLFPDLVDVEPRLEDYEFRGLLDVGTYGRVYWLVERGNRTLVRY